MRQLSRVMETIGLLMFLIGGCGMDNPTLAMFLTAIGGIGVAYGGYQIERLC